MARLVLGPLHRFADASRACVWVESDVAGLVGAGVWAEQGPRAWAPTFTVAGHHYALVTIEGLQAGHLYPYEVWLAPGDSRLDAAGADPPGAVRVWPEPGSANPPSLLRPVGGAGPVRLAFGSCRVTAPQARPYTLSPRGHPKGLGTDALHALALRMAGTDPSTWPHALLLLGDQVYADHVSPGTEERIRQRRDVSLPPGEEIADFTEYCWLYQEAWSQPEIRWLLSTIPTAMVGDDHDVRDDWNISAAWRASIRRQLWWDARITSGIMAYWLYQHLGNLDPDTREADATVAAVRERAARGEDSEDLLRAFAREVDRTPDIAGLAAGGPPAAAGPDRGLPAAPARWSFRWDLGRTRLVVIDCRLGRVVAPDGTRALVHDAEWAWVVEQSRHDGEVDHLLLGTSVPYLLTPMIHHLEAANESAAAGSRGRAVARLGERARQVLDLEQWAAFDRSFRQMSSLLAAVATGEHGPPPASVVVLSGDVHHAYLARLRLPGAGGAAAPVWQAVCSPFRNPLGPGIRRVNALAGRRAPAAVSRAVARLLGAPRPPVAWTVTDGPWFDSQIGTVETQGRAAALVLEKTELDGEPGGLTEVLRAPLA